MDHGLCDIMKTRTREFGGWTFKCTYDTSYGLGKSEAKEEAEKLRKQGCLARVTYSNREASYEVWTRRCRR